MQNNTIIAQATPIGPGAIALIRLSGKDAVDIAAQAVQLPGKTSLESKSSHTISFGAILDSSGRKIDQVLLLLMRGPQSFTGEDIVEITCHNNQLIVNAIITRCIELGARPAERGEFTRRAVENNKLSLLQAEAIQELISAQSVPSLQKSLAQLEGSLSKWLQCLETKLLTARALCEASFEFLEEEYNPNTQLSHILEEILATIEQAQEQFSAQKQLREGIRIALIGSTNAGKSSLLNALFKQNRAIVTPIAGTTRDTIEATVYKNGIAWTLIDTAGLRSTQDPIETAGIERTYQEAQKADLILLLIDGLPENNYDLAEYEALLKKYSEKCIVVQTKSDKQAQQSSSLAPAVFISSKDRRGLDKLENKIAQHLQVMLTKTALPFTLNQRHIQILTQIKTIAESIQKDLLAETQSYELISLKLQDVLQACTHMSGQEHSTQLLDAVFAQFCVGK